MDNTPEKKQVGKVLITGGTGLVGSHLVKLLKGFGNEVVLLSTNASKSTQDARVFYWNVTNGELDVKAFDGIERVINLSGASIAGGLWTKKRKQIIYNSRIEGTKLLLKNLINENVRLKYYFGTSAVGYYGPNNTLKPNIESNPPGNDFLAKVCLDWEAEHHKFGKITDRIVIGRLSNVLAPDGGMLIPFKFLSKFRLKVRMSASSHPFTWIHINDVVRFIHHSMTNDFDGIYNLSTGFEKWKTFQDIAFESFGSQWIRITMPAEVLKLIMGEMASLFMNGNCASGQMLRSSKLNIEYPDLEEALRSVAQ